MPVSSSPQAYSQLTAKGFRIIRENVILKNLVMSYRMNAAHHVENLPAHLSVNFIRRVVSLPFSPEVRPQLIAECCAKNSNDRVGKQEGSS